jgi:hypothetical protein
VAGYKGVEKQREWGYYEQWIARSVGIVSSSSFFVIAMKVP